jgi:hypothetical protein
MFRGVAVSLKQGGFGAFDHSRVISTQPNGTEVHALSEGDSLTSRVTYDETTRCCVQTWTGKNLAATESYWFPDLAVVDDAALRAGLESWGRWEWSPEELSEPFRPVRPASERLVTVFRRH